MEKVILVLDKPKSCIFCPVIDGETGECKSGGIIDDNENPTYCPLKPLPRRLDPQEDLSWYNANKIDGYNDCLNEILGE